MKIESVDEGKKYKRISSPNEKKILDALVGIGFHVTQLDAITHQPLWDYKGEFSPNYVIHGRFERPDRPFVRKSSNQRGPQ